ncbi:aspartate carbamoyltransferase [Granulicella cerasi]|uniref:Aspartate carbamoyltransferase n=1 Tax=Granulicella cerasi TaxID=741063 RepID=A0ABW1Z731_9BACT|nr:aspartate carbamoyltransferase [Granulicella cerasi]
MAEKLQHVLSVKQLMDVVLLQDLFETAWEFERDEVERKQRMRLSGRIMASMFYEPSTRTRFSFEAAMQRLGGGVLTAENAVDNSSSAKGESISDTARIIGGYADVIVMRHFQKGAVREAASNSPVPVINAGDGAGEHPTQALLDTYTIRKELHRLHGLRVAVVGDLKNGRTVHSLLPLLSLFPGLHVTLIAPPSLRLPQEICAELQERGVVLHETEEFSVTTLGEADVVYMTRVQQERFASVEEYEAVKSVYVLTEEIADQLKEEAIILHALPRLEELPAGVDRNLRAAYFKQAKNGLYVRMALLAYLLE